MDNLRFVLVVAFAFLIYLLWQQWQLDYGVKPPPSSPAPTTSEAPTSDVPASAGPAEVESAAKSTSIEAETPKGQRINVVTDVLHLEIDTYGGGIRVLDLLNYPVDKSQPDKPVRLLSDEPERLFVSQNGFITEGETAPNHHALWQSAQNEYRLQAGEASLRVPLTWTSDKGIKVVKTYVFNRGSYLIALEQQVSNQSRGVWQARQYAQLQRTRPPEKDQSTFIRTYTGGVTYTTADKYEKLSFDDMQEQNLNRKTDDGWIAMIQHYFLAAWIPPADEIHNFYTKALADDQFVIGYYSPTSEVAPGEEKVFNARLFAGPKLQRVLEATAPGLELTVDYGSLTLVAKPIFWLLEQFHRLFNNWGWAIVFVTIVIKALFFKLSAASYRSMANMRKLQPKIQALKERHGDDKQKFNQAMMELYRKDKVNPLGGCLPIVVQIPVFLSLYWVLVESVELRQVPFFLWINDLSSKDPYFILPLLMGVSMYIQQKLNPSPVDPVQAKVMQFFPIIFTVFFLFFPSGLVLYWVVNNVLSIIQQWYITKKIGAPAKA
jgi:YidC/Oxa1 family membrane protein insertase